MYCNLLSLVLGVVPYYSTGLLFVLAIKKVAPEQLCIVVRAHFMRYHVANLVLEREDIGSTHCVRSATDCYLGVVLEKQC
jgi:hypothetical protein